MRGEVREALLCEGGGRWDGAEVCEGGEGGVCEWFAGIVGVCGGPGYGRELRRGGEWGV
jgi:hypothetical protein